MCVCVNYCHKLISNSDHNNTLVHCLIFPVCDSEHQELAREVQQRLDPSTPHATADLEKQLEHLVDTLETKREQIRIVQKQLRSHKRKGAKVCTSSSNLSPSAAGETMVGVQAGEREMARTPSLEFLRRMKCLQNTLQQDDLSWD